MTEVEGTGEEAESSRVILEEPSRYQLVECRRDIHQDHQLGTNVVGAVEETTIVEDRADVLASDVEETTEIRRGID